MIQTNASLAGKTEDEADTPEAFCMQEFGLIRGEQC